MKVILLFLIAMNLAPSVFAAPTVGENMKVKLDGFKVAAIYSDDFDKSINFYTNVLGFVKVDNAGGGAHLKLDRGEKSVVIYVQGGYLRDSRTPDNSKISLVFDASSVKSALATAKNLNLSISMPYQEMGPGFAMLGILDPSGNQVMLMGPP